jgi:hypothetical protein
MMLVQLSGHFIGRQAASQNIHLERDGAAVKWRRARASSSPLSRQPIRSASASTSATTWAKRRAGVGTNPSALSRVRRAAVH